MKTPSRSTLPRKSVLLPASVLAGGLVLGSATAAVGALDGGGELTGEDLDSASAAALEEVGEGDVVSSEVSDDRGVSYEVEIRQPDGSEVDVDLDENNEVVHTDTEDNEDDDDDEDDDEDEDDEDDRRLTDAEWNSIQEAAITEAGGGTLTDAEVSDDQGEAFEAEVRLDDGTELDVVLDENFTVVDSHEDDAD